MTSSSAASSGSSMISLTEAMPDEMIVHIFRFLSPQEQACISRCGRLVHNSVIEVAQDNFFHTFGKLPSQRLQHKQVMGVLQNVLVANNSEDKAKKILCWAVSRGYTKLVRDAAHGVALRCLSGNLNLSPSEFTHEMTPLYLACRQGSTEIVQVLLALETVAVNQLCGPACQTIGQVAASRGHSAILALLRGVTGWHVNKRDSEGKTALTYAATEGHAECVRLLLESRANPSTKDKQHRSPLFYAAENGHAEAVKELLDRGAVVDSQSKAGKSPLFAACENGSLSVAELLLKAGANARLRTSRQKIPLYVVAEKGFADIAELLLEHSQVGDLFTMTSYGTTPFFIASKQADPAVKQLFKRFALVKKHKRKQAPAPVRKPQSAGVLSPRRRKSSVRMALQKASQRAVQPRRARSSAPAVVLTKRTRPSRPNSYSKIHSRLAQKEEPLFYVEADAAATGRVRMPVGQLTSVTAAHAFRTPEPQKLRREQSEKENLMAARLHTPLFHDDMEAFERGARKPRPSNSSVIGKRKKRHQRAALAFVKAKKKSAPRRQGRPLPRWNAAF